MDQVGLVFNDCYRFYSDGQLAHTFSDVLYELIPAEVTREWGRIVDPSSQFAGRLS